MGNPIGVGVSFGNNDEIPDGENLASSLEKWDQNARKFGLQTRIIASFVPHVAFPIKWLKSPWGQRVKSSISRGMKISGRSNPRKISENRQQKSRENSVETQKHQSNRGRFSWPYYIRISDRLSLSLWANRRSQSENRSIRSTKPSIQDP